MASYDDLRDRVIACDVRDLLAHDRRTAGLDISLEVCGGVAHVSGCVRDDEERRLLRRLIGRVSGIRAVWEMLELPGQERPRLLDIGCGPNKQYRCAIGLDHWPAEAVDIQAELEAGLPIRDGLIDQVFAVHVLEHVRELLPLMSEIHRVLRPDGELHVLAPSWRHVNAVIDPTHVRYFSSQTFKWFCCPHPGASLFWPLAVSESDDTVWADLSPVQPGEPPPSPDVLARFFD